MSPEMDAEGIISLLAGTSIALLWILPTSRISIAVVGTLCIVAGASMVYLRVGTWQAPVVFAFGVVGLIVYAVRKRQGGAKGDI